MSDDASIPAPHRFVRAGDGSPQPASPGVLGTPGVLGALGSSAGLALVGVLAQICYPLLAGDSLRFVTIASVGLLGGAGLLHAAATRGWAAAGRLLATAGGIGWVAETLGVHTGFPFGSYAYSGGLGPQLAGVPIVVPLAWTMLAYPCLLLGRRLARAQSNELTGRLLVAALGGITLAGWDLFLDPQMVAQGNWSWSATGPALPGVPGIPLTNYAGWLGVAVLMVAALDRALPSHHPAGAERPHAERIPAGILAWTWLGSAIGNLVFFDRAWVALYGGLVMGIPTAAYLGQLARTARSES